MRGVWPPLSRRAAEERAKAEAAAKKAAEAKAKAEKEAAARCGLPACPVLSNPVRTRLSPVSRLGRS